MDQVARDTVLAGDIGDFSNILMFLQMCISPYTADVKRALQLSENLLAIRLSMCINCITIKTFAEVSPLILVLIF